MESFSQSGQDKFVLSILQNKMCGKYLEIGAFDPISISNTYLLERDYSWEGFSLDIVSDYVDNFNSVRKNKCVLADGTSFDYDQYIKQIWGDIDRIDYLQVDCEPAENTYKCLTAVPFDKYRFSVITFETDYYACGKKVRDSSREYLIDRGYVLVACDVNNIGDDPFEDWYVDPSVVDESIFSKYVCVGKKGSTIC
jgi:hypothetical protein